MGSSVKMLAPGYSTRSRVQREGRCFTTTPCQVLAACTRTQRASARYLLDQQCARATHLRRHVLLLGQTVLDRQHRLAVVHMKRGLEWKLRDRRRIDIDQAERRVIGHHVPAAVLAPH